MIVELRPDQEKLVEDMVKSGQVHDVHELISQALAAYAAKAKPEARSLVELFEPVRGLFEDGELDFSRNPSTGRLIEL